ncbi:alpha/beta hydrolase family protein [Sphingobacterium suaedae]|uniref:Alpha/beta hydrolase family protein n=1 Tax=Sphingobacterium suaedae TaxID=1686402 RepID=A0ABW5KHX2_9SPHI
MTYIKGAFVFVFALFQSCWGYGQLLNESWKGHINVQQTQLPLIFHLKQNQGRWSGTLVSPAQSSGHIALDDVWVEGDSIRLTVRKLGLSFTGRRTKEATIEGVFSQGALRSTLILDRFIEKKRLRPQTPEPPYSYDTINVQFKNKFDETRLAGTISKPKGRGVFPAVVLVTGSGPQDRDETIEGHKPFKVIADYLTKRDIVVLRYDERGVGQSDGNYTLATIGDFSKDAMAAVEFLRKRKEVDASRVGIVGHSEGGLIALLIAGQSSVKVDFIGLLAAPTIPIDSLMLLQAYEIGRASGMSRAELNRAKVINRRNFTTVKSNLNDQQAYEQILDNMSSIFPEPSQHQRNEFKMLVLPSYRYFMRIDPVPFIQKIRIPVFAAFGTRDVQVPFAPNSESLTDNLPEGTAKELKVYTGLNHLFQHAQSGSVNEYAELEETFDTDVLEDLGRWIHTLN